MSIESIPTLIPEKADKILEKAESEKQNTKIDTIKVFIKNDQENSIDYEGKVIHWELDLRDEEEKDDENDPVIVFIEGYGQQREEGDLGNFEKALIKRGIEEGTKRFVFASTQSVPKKLSSGEYNAQGNRVNAALIGNVLFESLDIKKGEKIPPIDLTAYSIGASGGASLAATICEHENANKSPDEAVEYGKHTLTLTSASGLVEVKETKTIGDDIKMFGNEVLNIIKHETMSLFSNEESDAKQENVEKEEAELSLKNIGNKLKSLSALSLVISRVLTSDSISDFRNDASQVLNKNLDNEKVGGWFNVYLNLAIGDSLYWKQVDALEKSLPEHEMRGITWKNWSSHLYSKVFPKANEVKVRLLKGHHISPSKNADLFVAKE